MEEERRRDGKRKGGGGGEGGGPPTMLSGQKVANSHKASKFPINEWVKRRLEMNGITSTYDSCMMI